MQSSPLNRQPGHSRRTSEQDVVLPSVERDVVDLTSPRRTVNGQPPQVDARPASRDYGALHSPKRKALPSFHDDRGSQFGYETKRPRPVLHYEDDLVPRTGPMEMPRPAYSSTHQPMDSRDRPRAQPPPAVIDLTSSPRRPLTNRDHGHYPPALTHATAGPSGLSYIPVSARRSPMRETRALHYEVHDGEQPRVYMPNSGMYERRTPPAHDYISVRDEYQRRPVHEEDGRYLRSALHYGGLNPQ